MTKARVSLVTLVFLLWFTLSGSRPFSQQAFQSPISSSIEHTSTPAAPDPFGKQIPTHGAMNMPTNNLLLRWGTSSANVTYQYCLRHNKQSCPPPKWINVGANNSVILQSLTPNTTYYWQVRAVDTNGQITYADNNSWWQFTTIQNQLLPGPFTKLTPADTSTNQPVQGVILTWSESSLATSYQYCYDTQNNNTCDGSWINTSSLTASTGSLSFGTTYYWQVRAVNASGNIQADFGTWFSFQTVPAPGGAFGKIDPVNNSTEQSLNLTLTWGLSSGTGIAYEYCVSTTTCTASSTWFPAGTNLSANPGNLLYGMTYYWQVRAVNATATTYADEGASWVFSTQASPPAAFGKTNPANNFTNQPVSLNLTWGASAGVSSYEYCIDTIPCTSSSTWLLAGTSTSASVSGLSNGTQYYWQVRAINTTGTTYADGGTVFGFSTRIADPQAFGKLSPPTATNERVPTDLTLLWSPSVGATEYAFCLDTVSHPDGDDNCSSPGWVTNPTTETNHLNLANDQTYYWQVRAVNSQGSVQADNGSWWSFTTIDAPPSSFTKMSPFNGAVDQLLTPWLYWWTPSDPGNTYRYCITPNASCSNNDWTDIAENAPIHLTTPLAYDTMYYWQVMASNSGGTTYANDAMWSFTTVKSPPTSSNQVFSTNEDTALAGTLLATSNYDTVFSMFGSQPPGTLALESDGSFTYIPVQYFNGVVTFQFVVSDRHNPPVGPFTVTITVNPVNNPPVLSVIPDQVVEKGHQLTFWAQAGDPDLPYGDYLTYSIDEVQTYGANIDPVTGLFRWTVPSGQSSGVFTFTVRATDSGSLSAAQIVNITVTGTGVMYFPIIVR